MHKRKTLTLNRTIIENTEKKQLMIKDKKQELN